MKLNLIYCKNINNHIGYNGDLLYNIPEDMKYFKKITFIHFTAEFFLAAI